MERIFRVLGIVFLTIVAIIGYLGGFLVLMDQLFLS